MATEIYRGYSIYTVAGPNPVKVYKDGIKVWAGDSKDEAMVFIDRTKRELAAARKS